MKILHIESGLGNQMLGYCEYLAIKKVNPKDQCYIETLVYEFEESNATICQWNGYELEKVFGIREKNIKEIISEEQHLQLVHQIRKDEFWNRCWNWPVYFTKAFEAIGIHVENARGDFETHEIVKRNITDEGSFRYKIRNSGLYLLIKYIYHSVFHTRLVMKLNYEKDLYPVTGKDILTGQRLSFKYRNSGIEKIEDEIRQAFVFPEITDTRNRHALDLIQSVNSVAIHARRGDMLSINGYCYKNGYFRRAIKYIKHHVDNPEFFFFCDPGSISWCKVNASTFALDFAKDKVHFVDWNVGNESYRDMQLMASCKHNVITNSSFGWWGAWLNNNPNKITCSPDYRINTTHTF